MHTLLQRSLHFALAAATLTALGQAQSVFHATIDGPQMETDSLGTGSAVVTMDTTTGIVSVEGDFSGLTGDVLGIHIHGPALPFEHAPVKIELDFSGTTSGTISGGGPHQVFEGIEDMQCGLYYIVLHTSYLGGGEIRGQIVAEPAATEYGAGVNPAGSLTVLAGEPKVPSTFTLGLDNPTGVQSVPGSGLVFFSSVRDPLFNLTGSGTLLPGYGMSGPAAELLVSTLAPDLALIQLASGWTGPGNPMPFDITIPDNKDLVGLTFFAQGALFADDVFGLSNGLAMYVGT
jgi:hypothetical protein